MSDYRKSLNVEPERLLIVPGNHDADWTAPTASERFVNYQNFYESLKKEPYKDLHDEVSVVKGNESIRFVGVNSARIESEEFQGMGAVGEETLKQLLTVKTEPNGQGKAPQTVAATVLCMHHHVLPVTYVERDYYKHKRTSVTLDAKAILDTCIEKGVSMILHGHQHQPSLSYYGSMNPTVGGTIPPMIWISGVGSAGAVTKHMGAVKRRHFQVLEFMAEIGTVKCDIHSFMSHPDDEYAFKQGPSVSIKLGDDLSTSCSDLCFLAACEIKRIKQVSIEGCDNRAYLAFLKEPLSGGK